jgi:hypothetical protein
MTKHRATHRATDVLIDAMRQHYDKSISASCACDEESDMEQVEIVARYPASYHCQTEGDEIIVYKTSPKNKTDIFNFDSKTTKDRRPPRSLSELNKFFAGYYPRRRTTAAR